MPSCSRPKTKRAFTIVELLVAVTILLLILVTVVQFSGAIDHAWKSNATDPFAEAQDAFDIVARNLANATLEPYSDYADTTGAFRTSASFVPDHLARRSDLAFVCGPASGTSGLLASTQRTTTGSAIFFLAPQGVTQTDPHSGLEYLLNAMGYFVEFGDDDATPAFIPAFSHRWRWRLRQIQQPSESLQIFSTATSAAWIQQLAPAGATFPVLAENIVTLLVEPERAASDTGTSLAPAFAYDSRDTTNVVTLHQLPLRLRIVLVAMDEPSAEHLAVLNGSNAPALVPSQLFQQAAQLDADLNTLDAALAAQKINHRLFQREILLPSAAWSNVTSQ
jgi:uncharacterized protein (TIGR02599 family)